MYFMECLKESYIKKVAGLGETFFFILLLQGKESGKKIP